MKEYHIKFISLFSVIFLLLSFVVFYFNYHYEPRDGRSVYYSIKRGINNMNSLMYEQLENVDEVDPQTYFKKYAASIFKTDEQPMAQSFFYCGDFPEMKAEYVVIFYRGKQSHYVKFNTNDFYDFEVEKNLIRGKKNDK